MVQGLDIGRSPSLQILLATYNGEEFLPELLESLFAQTEQGFVVLAADDGSSDKTVEILERYSGRFPERLRIVSTARAGGAPRNFARLLELADADHIMFCDQDDVWLPHKIAASIERMRGVECQVGKDTPVLVHSDLVVVDSNLATLHDSCWQMCNIDPARDGIGHLLMQNVARGCAITINRALYEKARPIPEGAAMHDFWCILVASAFGRISAIRKPGVLYRQHGHNVSGVRPWNLRSTMYKVWKTIATPNPRRGLAWKSRQAQQFLAVFADQLDPADRKTVEALAEIWSHPRHRRFLVLRENDLAPRSFLRRMALVVTASRPNRKGPEYTATN